MSTQDDVEKLETMQVHMGGGADTRAEFVMLVSRLAARVGEVERRDKVIGWLLPYVRCDTTGAQPSDECPCESCDLYRGAATFAPRAALSAPTQVERLDAVERDARLAAIAERDAALVAAALSAPAKGDEHTRECVRQSAYNVNCVCGLSKREASIRDAALEEAKKALAAHKVGPATMRVVMVTSLGGLWDKAVRAVLNDAADAIAALKSRGEG